MAKKLTPAAIALMNAARNGGPDAMRAAIDEIVKDAPPIPGLVELEEKYSAGNIPMQAVHESTTLSLKDKKFLFQIAGFEYDGSMHPTEAEYEAQIYWDTAHALAGTPLTLTRAELKQRDKLLAWGFTALPGFELSAKRMFEALAFAAVSREKSAAALAAIARN